MKKCVMILLLMLPTLPVLAQPHPTVPPAQAAKTNSPTIQPVRLKEPGDLAPPAKAAPQIGYRISESEIGATPAAPTSLLELPAERSTPSGVPPGEVFTGFDLISRAAPADQLTASEASPIDQLTTVELVPVETLERLADYNSQRTFKRQETTLVSFLSSLFNPAHPVPARYTVTRYRPRLLSGPEYLVHEPNLGIVSVGY